MDDNYKIVKRINEINKSLEYFIKLKENRDKSFEIFKKVVKKKEEVYEKKILEIDNKIKSLKQDLKNIG